MVVPGSYTVSLVSDGKVVDTKPLRLVMDPTVQLADGPRARYNAVLVDLHEQQRRGTEAARPLAALFTEVQKVALKVDSSAAPQSVKDEWAAFRKEFDALRAKFGVGVAAGGFGGGGGGAAAIAAAAANALGRVSGIKGAVMGVWEAPSNGTMRQVNEAKAALSAAMSEADTFMTKARAMGQKLAQFNVTLVTPAS